jgi:hypothetical protein
MARCMYHESVQLQPSEMRKTILLRGGKGIITEEAAAQSNESNFKIASAPVSRMCEVHLQR